MQLTNNQNTPNLIGFFLNSVNFIYFYKHIIQYFKTEARA